MFELLREAFQTKKRGNFVLGPQMETTPPLNGTFELFPTETWDFLDFSMTPPPPKSPRVCKLYSLYNRCKFGEYCDFEHRENPLEVEMSMKPIGKSPRKK